MVKIKPNLTLMVANASTHQGESFEVQFMAKIGEINQEKVSRRRKSYVWHENSPIFEGKLEQNL